MVAALVEVSRQQAIESRERRIQAIGAASAALFAKAHATDIRQITFKAKTFGFSGLIRREKPYTLAASRSQDGLTTVTDITISPADAELNEKLYLKQTREEMSHMDPGHEEVSGEYTHTKLALRRERRVALFKPFTLRRGIDDMGPTTRWFSGDSGISNMTDTEGKRVRYLLEMARKALADHESTRQ